MGKQDRKRARARQETPAQASSDAGHAVTATSTEGWARLIARPWFAPALFGLVALVYFWEFPLSGKIIFGSDIGTDYHKGTAPVVEKLGELVPSAWDPRMGGYPISDEIRHKFFPTYLIELFTTKQRAIGWRYLLAVFGAGWGMFLYLRQIGVSRAAALWGGLAFLSAPTFLSFPFAGQYAKMTVIALFPPLCLCLERGMDGGRRAAGSWVLMAVLIALGVFSPHLQMLQYALLGLGLYFLYKLAAMQAEGAARSALAQRVGLFALAVALGLGLGAEGVFPPYQHVRTQSKRAAIQDEGGRNAEEQLGLARSWSLHPEEMASLVIPEFVGFHDPKGGQNHYWGRNPMKLNSEYFGILVVLLALLMVPEARRKPLVLFLCLLFGLVAAFTLGAHTPVHWLAFHLLPGGKVLRAIGMSAYLFAFPACVLAALSLHRVLSPADGAEAEVLRRRLLITGGVLAGLCLLTAAAPGAVLEAWRTVFWGDMPDNTRQAMAAGADWVGRGALLVGVVVAAGTALMAVRLTGRLATAPVVLGLAALTLADTWRIDRLFLHYEDPARWSDFRQVNPRTVSHLRQQPGKFRVFPIPSYSFLSDPRFHLDGADVVTAFNNYTLRRYDRLLDEFRTVEGVLQGLVQARLRGQAFQYTDDQVLAAIAPLLDLVNARYLVTPGPVQLQAKGYPEAFAAEGVRLYENPGALPWFQLHTNAVVIEGETSVLRDIADGQVDLRRTVVLEATSPIALPGPGADVTADRVRQEVYDYHDGVVRVRVQAGGPRLLVVSDNFHPHWRATVDGAEAPIVRANYVWKAVPVPAGEHTVELTYHSRPVAIARTVSAVCAALVLAYVGFALWRRRSGLAPVTSADEPASAPG